MSSKAMVSTVSSEKGDPSACNRTDADRRGCRPERCADLDVDGVIDKVVEP